MGPGLNWSNFYGTWPELEQLKQEQQHTAVGPVNTQSISVRQVASDAAMLRRCTCGPLLLQLPQLTE